MSSTRGLSDLSQRAKEAAAKYDTAWKTWLEIRSPESVRKRIPSFSIASARVVSPSGKTSAAAPNLLTRSWRKQS